MATMPPTENMKLSNALFFVFMPTSKNYGLSRAMTADDHARGEEREDHYSHKKDHVTGIENAALESLKMGHDTECGDSLDQPGILGELIEHSGHGRPSSQNHEQANDHREN